MADLPPSKSELSNMHGTPIEFEAAIWRACDELFFTVDEAVAAIAKYKKDWAEASDD